MVVRRLLVSPRALVRVLSSGDREPIVVEDGLPGDARLVYADYDAKAGKFLVYVSSGRWPDVPAGTPVPAVEPDPTFAYIPQVLNKAKPGP